MENNLNPNPKSKPKKIKLQSEAYPLTNGSRPKIPIQSETHSIIRDSNHTINPTLIKYKKLGRIHLEEIINLHKEWFPVRYDNSFFENALGNVNNTFITLGAMYTINQKELILGAILIELQEFNRKFKKHSSDEILEKISNEISFNAEMSATVSLTDYHCAYIMTLGVIDECRRLKIASELMNKALDIVLEDPLCICLFLDVISYNQSAIRFYIRNGFEEVTTMKNHYCINEQYYDSKVYVKVITNKEKMEHQRKVKGVVYQTVSDWFNMIVYSFVMVITFNVFCKCLRKKHKLS